MKRTIISLLTLVLAITTYAQEDSTSFYAYLINKEYKVFMRISFHRQDIVIPGQDILGPLPGYLGKEGYTFCWPVITADVEGKRARLQMVNDYGSEDLEAVLAQEDDTTYILRQGKGSTLKVPAGSKWQKLPKQLVFVRKNP